MSNLIEQIRRERVESAERAVVRHLEQQMNALKTGATPEQKLEALKADAHAKLREAEKAWHAYFAECDVGRERIFASNVYEILRTATREAQP